jgi:hypothetical protein
MSILIGDLIGFASGEDKEMKCAAVTILALLSRYLHSLPQLLFSVADPNPDPLDPHVFGPPESGSGFIRQRHGSGSFYH